MLSQILIKYSSLFLKGVDKNGLRIFLSGCGTFLEWGGDIHERPTDKRIQWLAIWDFYPDHIGNIPTCNHFSPS